MDKPLVEGNYLIYKNKPLVRNENYIIYGDMNDKFYVQLILFDEKEDSNGNSVPDNILIQILDSSNKSIAKQEFSRGLYESLELASIWLNRYNGN